MDSFEAVRKLARAKHEDAKARASGGTKAIVLLRAAREVAPASVQPLPSEHPLLAGGDGALHRKDGVASIYISSALAPELAAYVEAHEFGHLWIETPDEPAVVAKGSDPGGPEQNSPLGLRRVQAYSPQELRERYANVFAREFLLPGQDAQQLFRSGKSAATIAVERGLPLGLVYQQLAVALLLPDASDRPGGETAERPDLDPSQRNAAEHEGGPLLVEAGPGTGKTRTLIARIEHLLARNVPAPSILALTFSNKAAREIWHRVAATAPQAAPEIWAGTFHAFGLEFLRKFGHLDGLPESIRLLDQADQLALLERDLPALGLDHYLRLHEPLLELRYILGAISRAKDEVFTPDDYAQAAQNMRANADGDPERILRADKATEVAHVYAHYEKRLRDEGLVDFADLINRPIEILRSHPDVRDELRGQYRHQLVDEYQDVNRASALLLRELAGDGANLWVVGDARQSIYRFRGAAPSNTTNFEQDYARGTRTALEINYRSRKQIVDAFGAFAGHMRVGRSSRTQLTAQRGPGVDVVDINVSTNRDSEVAGIAAAIDAHRAAGRAYADQAVLCRTHAHLQRIAAGLEAAGIPILYLGDLFERNEVRDLLAVLSFVAERHRGGLLRVATLAPYRMPLADVRTFLAHCATSDTTPPAALADVEHIAELSPEGRAALRRLGADLVTVGFKTGPGQFLCDLLFERGFIRDYLGGMMPADQQKRLAIHQFLQFAIENDGPGPGDPKRRLLDWIRRLEVFGDERALRETPAAVEGIDAVRLMTVHQSKGLEFKVVHLPTLGRRVFPLQRQWERCPAPEGMRAGTAEDDHAEEEECLFYVALSRAKDHLSLSRAERYSDKQRSNPSEFVEAIRSHLPRPPDAAPTWTAPLTATQAQRDRPDLRVFHREHDARDIELYLKCPRSYLYQAVLDLSGSRVDNGYVRFHRTVYRVLHWLSEQGGRASEEHLATEFEVRWAETGPFDHPFEPLYRRAATHILGLANARPRQGVRFGETLSLKLGQHTLEVVADEIEVEGASFVVRRLRSGRPPKAKDQRHLHALIAEAGRQTLGSGARFELHYLSTNQPIDASFAAKTLADRLDAVRDALAAMEEGRYPAEPSDDCPRCPHYFICDSVPD